jgi:HlyD family secretion protein
MPVLLRNRFVWIAVIILAVAGGGSGFLSNRATAEKARAAAATAQVNPSPYAAIASGKADVEGGIIQVAARRAGVIQDVLVQEGDMVRRGQVLARLEDDQPRLASVRAAKPSGSPSRLPVRQRTGRRMPPKASAASVRPASPGEGLKAANARGRGSARGAPARPKD